jgi:hypothetical protein
MSNAIRQRQHFLVRAPLTVRLGKAGDQRRRRCELRCVAGQDRLSPERDRQVVCRRPTFSPLAIQRDAAGSRIYFGSIDGRRPSARRRRWRSCPATVHTSIARLVCWRLRGKPRRASGRLRSTPNCDVSQAADLPMEGTGKRDANDIEIGIAVFPLVSRQSRSAVPSPLKSAYRS